MAVATQAAVTRIMPTKCLLLAGGLGTRLRPLTDTTPKCLVPVGGRPLLDYWFDAFSRAGITEVRINTHHLPDQVRKYIERKNASGNVSVSEAHEPTLLGSAGTVRANRDWIRPDDTALIVYADNLSDVDLSQFLQFHRSHGGPVTMMLFHTPYPTKCGIAGLDEQNRIVEFVEKPQHPRSDLANAGVYAVTASAFHEMADMRKFDLGFDVLPAFVGRMFGWVWSGYHRDIGSPEALRQAELDAQRLFGVRQGR